MRDVEVGRPPGGLGPVDEAGPDVAVPQRVARVEVTVDQVLGRRRGRSAAPVDGLRPQVRPGRPRRHLEHGRGPRREGWGSVLLSDSDGVHGDGDAGQSVDRRRSEAVQPDPARQERREVRPAAGRPAVGVAGDEDGGRHGGATGQPAAQGLPHHPLERVGRVRVARVEPAQDRCAGGHRDPPDRVGEATGDPLGAEHVLPEGVGAPAPDPVGQHLGSPRVSARVRAGGAARPSRRRRSAGSPARPRRPPRRRPAAGRGG